MRQRLSAFSEAVENNVSAIAEIREFYETIALASKNLVLGMLLNSLHRMSEPTRVQYDESRWRARLQSAKKLLDAIEKGDAETARDIATRTMNAAGRYQAREASDMLSDPVSWRTAE